MAIRRLVRVLSVFCLMIVFLGSALAADYQSVVEKTMKNKLLEHGMSMRIATRLAIASQRGCNCDEAADGSLAGDSRLIRAREQDWLCLWLGNSRAARRICA